MTNNNNDSVQSDQTTLQESSHSEAPLPSVPKSSVGGTNWSRRLWLKLRMSPRDLRNMIKLSFPSVIVIALFQSDFIANYFTVNGYIGALVALTVMPTLPRARFISALLQTIFATCLAAAVVLLVMWCGIQARIHTTNPMLPPEKYNSSQAGVFGTWLFFLIWSASTFKSANALAMMPVLVYEIYIIVGCTNGVSIQNMPDAMVFCSKLLVNFLLGQAVSTGISLFIFPLSSRTVFFEAVTGYLKIVRKCLKTQQAYLRCIQEQDPWRAGGQNNAGVELMAHKKALNDLYGAAAKMRGELEHARKEITFGKLDPRQMSDVSELALRIMPAFSGLGFIYDALDQMYDTPVTSLSPANEGEAVNQWQIIMQALYPAFTNISDAMDLATDHVLLVLQLEKRDKGGFFAQNPVPGSPDFLSWYQEQTVNFAKTREMVARLWFEKEGIQLPEDFLNAAHDINEKHDFEKSLSSIHRKPFTVIYIHFLLYSASHEILELIELVDSMSGDGILSKRRLIVPSSKHLRRWASEFFRRDRKSDATLSTQDKIISYNLSDTHSMSSPQTKLRKDPEHLPASRWWEVSGDYIRLLAKLMRSSHATHGFRVACAVMSVAVGFYIKTSSSWFATNRWLWAMFAIVLTMNKTAGMTVFMFLCRVGGTAVAMCASFAVYYMVVGHTVGVLIMMWVAILIVCYLTFRFPFYTPATIVTLMAIILMIGNELEDKKLGFARVTAAGQAAHEEYLMAPERLAIVSAGIGIGFFWTIFPYPLSEHSGLRQDLASTLYYLASHHSMVSKTVSNRARGLEPHMATRNQNELARARLKCFTKLQFLFSHLRQHLGFTKYQVILGGRFPKAQYTELVCLCEKICTASNVIVYASMSFVRAWEDSQTSTEGQPHPEIRWLNEFRSLSGTIETASHEVIGTLISLSNHMAAGSPFPPNIKSPELGKLVHMVNEIRGNMLTISHVAEPGYAAFVTMTMAGRGISRALARQMEICKELVGVLDFSDLVDEDMEKGMNELESEEMAPAMP